MQLGAVNDVTARTRTSNECLVYTALRIGGGCRYPFPNKSKAYVDADGGIQKLRNYYNQLGHGVKTGIDFPYEEVGLEGPSTSTGLLNIGIGQYDTYSTIQMAQYVSTIANDGYRVQHHIVKEIRNHSQDEELGSIFKVNERTVLNKLNVKDEHLDRVQE